MLNLLKLKDYLSEILRTLPRLEKLLRTVIHYYRNVPIGPLLLRVIKRLYKIKTNKKQHSAAARHLYQTFLSYKNHKP